MRISGILKLRENDKVEYIIDGCSVGTYELTESLNMRLMDEVKVKVEVDGEVLFNEEGCLLKFKDKYTGLYNYMVNNSNLEEVLWNNTNKKVVMIIERLDGEESER